MTSILILNYNGKEHVERCLLALRVFTDAAYELIVIDNGSTDGSQEFLRAADAPNMTLVENPENIGCPPARAQGMSLAGGDYIVFLDNDTVVTSGWLSRLIRHCENDPAIGMLGPSTNYISGPQMIPGVAYETTPELVSIAETMALHFEGVLQPTTRLVGFCMFMRRAVVDAIGCCDPRFGKYGFEDDDYSIRAILAGFRLCIARDVFIHHLGSRGQVDGGLDYSSLVREAWSVFRDKWGLPADLEFAAYGSDRPLHLPERSFDPSLDYIPAPDRAEIEPFITRRP
ncbi:glycosyltransferase family 2 protein [Candidatus Poribacteria bacterium]|jgi:O-antigen biosynthesis protein|nr:glycosyltransferase family 2 protein [Candidatus Poribacteria bacterium]MBT5531439.1 glycosyltransferase family 2 protein [Candidatus Poribacteria bacterium]MBT5712157.1 glycosyltransferase family 2 protein [Candidatus Poribacteria bacterium]MBT7099498.1 glycosyltransferase family 2 protein [Candidatus Poribacteria bacterium]MBT7804792.1 glycosyltransferase family 2 protein [Candidatus Poribacteria bacterium]